MNKAMKAAINTWHEKSCPNIILPAQYLWLDPNKIAVHTDKEARMHHLSVLNACLN